MPDDPLRLCGKELNGRYRAVRQLGAGGMGVVYEAVQIGQETPCAVKLIRADFGLSARADELLRRFRREAKIGGQVQHPGLVQVFDLDQLADGTLFYAMELLSGCSLGEILARGGPLAWQEAVEVGLQAADALGALHEARLVHRDLKPDNLQMLEDGRVKVLDLGVAHVSAVLSSDSEEPTDVRTKTGQYLGTPAYMAPEQLEDSRRVDGRADVYALGLVIFELCTGLQPFRGRRLEEVLQLKFLRRPVPPLRGHCPAAPAALERLLATAVGPREERPEMAALAAALTRLLPQDRAPLQARLAERVAQAAAPMWAAPTLPAPPPAIAPVRRRPRRRLDLRLAAGAAIGVLGCAGVLLAGRALLGARGPSTVPPATPTAAAAPLPAPSTGAPPAADPARAALLAPGRVVDGPARADRPPAAVATPSPGRAVPPPLRADRPPPPAPPAAPAPGRLRVAVRPFAEIFIDGVHRREGSPYTYAVPAGRHRVRAINTALGQDETRTVQVPPRGHADVQIDWSGR